MAQIVGIDGGGTRTRAVAVGPGARLLGVARAGCGNFQVLGLDGLEALLGDLWPRLGVQLPLSALCLGLAGAGRPTEQRAIAEWARERNWAGQVRVVSDAQAALVGAHGSQAGLVVIAGTGSMVLGRNAQGEQARAGGWGPLLGDEGSGYHLGMEGIRAALRARDGWGPATALDPRLRRALGLEDWDQVVRWIYGGELERGRVAALGLEVVEAAREGDGCALAIVAAAGQALGRQLGAVARKLGLEEGAPVAGVGGLFAARPFLWPALVRAARAAGCRPRWRDPLLPPVLGAVLIAWEAAGLEPGAAVAALAGLLPEQGFEPPGP
jgi:N-acetylglucosamine kinase-like BadF-type ATPase